MGLRSERLSQVADVLSAISDCVNHAAMGMAPSPNPPDPEGDAGFLRALGIVLPRSDAP